MLLFFLREGVCVCVCLCSCAFVFVSGCLLQSHRVICGCVFFACDSVGVVASYNYDLLRSVMY